MKGFCILMKRLYLKGLKNILKENNTTMHVEYYLVEENSTERFDEYLYSIMIIKREKEIIEMEESGGLSYSRVFVEELTETLVENDVTPFSMIDIIDDLITLKLCS